LPFAGTIRPYDIVKGARAQRHWLTLDHDGTVVKWLQQVSDFFMVDAGVTRSIHADEYFDRSLYLSQIK
jgi:NitT/TauT family transport system substrate-binding protein